MDRSWPYTLPAPYLNPDNWMRITEWWRRQDVALWTHAPKLVAIEVSYGLPFRSVGELTVINSESGTPLLIDAPGTTRHTGMLAGLPSHLRWPGFTLNTLLYAGLAWWLCRGRQWLYARRRRAHGRCPGCGTQWSGGPSDTMCADCLEWAIRPRIRLHSSYWWQTTLALPAWLTLGLFATLLIAWGGPYAGKHIGDHFISQYRRSGTTWPGALEDLENPEVLDVSGCWWGVVDSYQRGNDHAKEVRAGSPFPCLAGIWNNIGGRTLRQHILSPSTFSPPRLQPPTQHILVFPVTNTFSLELPTRILWPGLLLNMFFWSAVLWFAWRGPAALRRWRWSRTGRCGNCGYNLEGLPLGARCPECGTVSRRDHAPRTTTSS